MTYPGRTNIYEATIKRMVAQALEAQEQEFIAAHYADEEEQLLTYLRQCADTLHHSPWPREIVGGRMIEERFGTWSLALSLAGLAEPCTADLYQTFQRVKEETERQRVCYREKKEMKKLRHQQRLAAKKQND